MKMIKPLIFIWISLFIFQLSFGQTPVHQPKPKSIHVNGSAEMEIIPDELFFTVILREYLDKDKKKVKIESLEKELQSAVSSANVSKENLQFENVFGERWK